MRVDLAQVEWRYVQVGVSLHKMLALMRFYRCGGPG